METNQWLTKITGIQEGIPYHANITSGEELPYDASLKDIASHRMDGLAMFKMKNGRLHFDFVGDENTHELAQPIIAKSPKPIISIPVIEFTHSFEWRSLRGDHKGIEGTVSVKNFGDESIQLDGVHIELEDLPNGWSGANNYCFYEGSAELGNLKVEGGNTYISNSRPGSRLMKGVKMEADGWQVDLWEVPPSTHNYGKTPYQCNLKKTTDTMTGADAERFIEENLFPFLTFVFGQRIRFRAIVGLKDGVQRWAVPGRGTHPPASTYQHNWFTMQRANPTDLQPLFRTFCEADPDIKNHWRKVITQYADSEEIIGTLGRPTIAASLSFAGIEGLTRSIISTLPSKDEWLDEKLSLRRGKGVIAAIEVAAQEFFGESSIIFKEASRNVSSIRNATFHTDLTMTESQVDAYYRWQASQCLIESLLLVQLGLNSIPNRTAHPTFNILGQDMFADVRAEEIRFPSD